jgi:hypothetical protein
VYQYIDFEEEKQNIAINYSAPDSMTCTLRTAAQIRAILNSGGI